MAMILLPVPTAFLTTRKILPAVIGDDAVYQTLVNKAVEDPIDGDTVHRLNQAAADAFVVQRGILPTKELENGGLGSSITAGHVKVLLQRYCGCGKSVSLRLLNPLVNQMIVSMTKHSTFILFLLLLTATFVSTGCEDDDPEVPNEEEVITNATFTLTSANGDIVLFTFLDPDGDGGTAPIITQAGNVAPNTTYNGSLALTNASDPTDIEDITAEVREEDEEHQVFYSTSTGLNMTFAYDDVDGDGNPLGLMTNVTTGESSSGTMTVVLRHEPNKGATGIAINNPDAAGGETDIEVTFEVMF